MRAEGSKLTCQALPQSSRLLRHPSRAPRCHLPLAVTNVARLIGLNGTLTEKGCASTVSRFMCWGVSGAAREHSDAALVIALRAAAVQIRVDTSIF